MNKAGVYPYKRTPKHRAVALAATRTHADVEDEATGSYTTMRYRDIPPSTSLYIDARKAQSWLRSGVGEAVKYGTAMSRYFLHDREMYPLPGEIAPSLADLMTFRDFVESVGGSMLGKSGTAVSLLRASLDRPLRLRRGDSPPLARIIGGRIHVGDSRGACRMVPEVEAWDISAAYASTLANLRVDGVWKEGKLNLDSEREEQFARVAIRIPKMAYGPLPSRKDYPNQGLWWDIFGEREFPVGKTAHGVKIHGTWSADELRAAVEVGAIILNVEKSWRLLSSSRYPFAEWWDTIQQARALPGKAGMLGKVVGNVLWGIFAPSDDVASLVRYQKGTRKPLKSPLPSSPRRGWNQDYPLAELVTSKVRAKVYRELIAPSDGKLVSVCVDGGLTEPGFKPVGEGWRLKERGFFCCFLKPFIYAYEVSGGRIVYKLAGIPEEHKRSAFESHRRLLIDWPAESNPSMQARTVYRFLQAFNGSCIERSMEGIFVPKEVSDYVKEG